MKHHPLFGLCLAAFGTLMLAPDSLFMRLSGMSGFQMNAWRGLLMGSVFLVCWICLSRSRRQDIAALKSGAGLTVVTCQFFNAMLFCLGISIAPVAVVLLGIASVPVFAAVFAWFLLGEPTRLSTWLAIAAVVVGIGVAVSGGTDGQVSLDVTSLLGVLLGLGVAIALAVNFVVLRARPKLPILLAIGCGALASGTFGMVVTGPSAMMDGQIWAIVLTGGVILPVSFFSLSLASRYTHAANVSLLMLMETILGPLWVWYGIGETPTGRMLIGGAIVVISLAIYLIATRKPVPQAI